MFHEKKHVWAFHFSETLCLYLKISDEVLMFQVETKFKNVAAEA